MPLTDATADAAGRAIVGAGTSEAAWQSWSGLADVPVAEFDELTGPPARLVVVAPHPDDEVLTSGGLMAIAAERRLTVRVIAVTDGDASHPGSQRWAPDALGRERSRESALGLRRLGLDGDDAVRLRIGDGHIGADEERLTATLTPLLHASDTVVTTWRLDGHPDHEACARAVLAAAAAAGCALLEAPVWMWHWAAPGDPRVPWRRLRRLRLGDDVLRRKRRAIEAHETQLAPRDDGVGPVLGADALARLMRPDEYFFIAE